MKRLLLPLLLLAAVRVQAAEPTEAPPNKPGGTVTFGPGTFSGAIVDKAIAAAENSPRIEIDAEYEPHKPIVAKILGDAQVYLWDDPEGFDAIEADGGKTWYIWAAPGKYKLRCLLLTIDWESKMFMKAVVRAEFTVGDSGPGPNPNQKWQVSFFVESADGAGLPPGQRAILAGLKCRDDLAAKGHRFVQVFDDDQVGPKNTLPDAYRPWFDAWKESKLPLPCVAIAPLAGGTIKVFPLPADQAALGKLLEKGGL